MDKGYETASMSNHLLIFSRRSSNLPARLHRCIVTSYKTHSGHLWRADCAGSLSPLSVRGRNSNYSFVVVRWPLLAVCAHPFTSAAAKHRPLARSSSYKRVLLDSRSSRSFLLLSFRSLPFRQRNWNYQPLSLLIGEKETGISVLAVCRFFYLAVVSVELPHFSYHCLMVLWKRGDLNGKYGGYKSIGWGYRLQTGLSLQGWAWAAATAVLLLLLEIGWSGWRRNLQ